MEHHGVFDGLIGEDIARGDAAVIQLAHRARRLAGDLQPHRLPGRRQRGVRQRQPKPLGDDLRRAGGAEELAAAAGRTAGLAAEFGGLIEGQFAIGEAGADGLDLARGVALVPELAARARPVPGLAGRERLLERVAGKVGERLVVGAEPAIAASKNSLFLNFNASVLSSLALVFNSSYWNEFSVNNWWTSKDEC